MYFLQCAGHLRVGFPAWGRVLFLPDQHLGRNTGLKMGIRPDEMVLWSPFEELGGNTEEELVNSK